MTNMMIGRARLPMAGLIGSVALAVGFSPVFAQAGYSPRPGTEQAALRAYSSTDLNTDVYRKTLERNDAVETAQYAQMQAYGGCLTRIGKSYSTKMIDASPGSASERALYVGAQDRFKGCPMAKGNPPYYMMRGSLAEASYKSAHKGDASDLPVANEVLLKAFMTEQAPRLSETPDGLGAAAAAMTCLAATAPQTSHRIIVAKHGSDEEKALMDSIFKEAPGCSSGKPPEGVSRSMMRALLAQGLYRWSLANKSS